MTFVQNPPFFYLSKDNQISVLDFVLSEEGNLSCRLVCKEWLEATDVVIKKRWDELFPREPSYMSVLYLFSRQKYCYNDFAYIELFRNLHLEWKKQGVPIASGELKITASYHKDLSNLMEQSLMKIWERVWPQVYHFSYYVNELSTVRAWVGSKITKKVWAKVESGYLSGIDLTFIPKEICNFSRLRMIDLSNNRIVKVPSFLGDFENLKILNLQGNHIEDLPKEFSSWTHLDKIDLRNNPLNHYAKEQIAEWRKNRTISVRWRASSCDEF